MKLLPTSIMLGHQKKPETICVLGAPRSGTSMIAGMLRILGIDMGANLDPATNEDVDFLGHKGIREVFRNEKSSDSYIDQLRKVITSRGSKQTWGWKDPLSSYYVSKIHKELKDPAYIVVMRDPIATVMGEIRYRKRENIEVDELHMAAQLRDIFSEYKLVVDFLEQCDSPVLYVSYEQAVKNKQQLIDSVAEFINVEINAETRKKLEDYIQPGRNTGAI